MKTCNLTQSSLRNDLINRRMHGFSFRIFEDEIEVQELKKLFESEVIGHETSCPYTPQHNSLAERKIGNIMDKARTLMIQASLPKSL